MSTGQEDLRRSNEELHLSQSQTVVPPVYYDANPALKLTTEMLNGNNYLSWSESVLLALGAKSLLNHITDHQNSPIKTDPYYNQWIATDKLVRLWVLNSMEPPISRLFFSSNSAFDLWQTVKDMFGQQNNFDRIFQLKRELYQTKQGSQTITQLYGSIKSKLDELNMYEPITADLKILQQRYEHDRVYLLLNALNSDYEQVRSQILYSTELPTISNVISLLQREETRKAIMNLTIPNTDLSVEKSVLIAEKSYSSRNYTSNRGRGRGRGNRPAVYCDHCAREGHSRDRCWILYPHLKPRREKGSNSGGHQLSAHTAANSTIVDPPKFTLEQLSQLLQQLSVAGNPPAQAAEGQTTAPKIGKGAGKSLSFEKIDLVNSWVVDQRNVSDLENIGSMGRERKCPKVCNLTEERNLSGLGNIGPTGRERNGPKFANNPLEIKKCSNNTTDHKSLAAHFNKTTENIEWIVDSGATDHMVNCNINLNHLTKLKDAQNVYLADGSTTPILETGHTNLFGQPIKNVLCIPKFPSNLLSVGKITSEL
jgi:gag-polypeptide of LTR copia-type